LECLTCTPSYSNFLALFAQYTVLYSVFRYTAASAISNTIRCCGITSLNALGSRHRRVRFAVSCTRWHFAASQRNSLTDTKRTPRKEYHICVVYSFDHAWMLSMGAALCKAAHGEAAMQAWKRVPLRPKRPGRRHTSPYRAAFRRAAEFRWA
jgi:hypothetical protein